MWTPPYAHPPVIIRASHACTIACMFRLACTSCNCLSSRCTIAGKTLRFCYDRLSSLIKTLEITDTDDYVPIHLVADFATLAGTYVRGFAIIIEPFDERLPSVPDPVIQLRCSSCSQCATVLCSLTRGHLDESSDGVLLLLLSQTLHCSGLLSPTA